MSKTGVCDLVDITNRLVFLSFMDMYLFLHALYNTAVISE